MTVLQRLKLFIDSDEAFMALSHIFNYDDVAMLRCELEEAIELLEGEDEEEEWGVVVDVCSEHENVSFKSECFACELEMLRELEEVAEGLTEVLPKNPSKPLSIYYTRLQGAIGMARAMRDGHNG